MLSSDPASKKSPLSIPIPVALCYSGRKKH
jgi:hypothetical protein